MSHATARLLRERHGLDDGEAEHILGSFVDAVENSLEEYGICHVAGVGTFVRAPGDRRISFEPAESLSRAVNVRFADLPVYEVDRDGASRDTTPHPIPEAEEPDILAQAPVQVQEPKQEPAPESDAATQTEPAQESDTAAPARETVADEMADVPEPVMTGHVPETDEPDADQPARPGKPSLSGSRSPRRRKKERSGSSRAAWFALPVVIAIAAGAVWFLQRPDRETGPLAGETPPAAQPSESTDDRNTSESGSADAAGVLPDEEEAGIDTARSAEGNEDATDPVQAPVAALSQAEPSTSADSGPAYTLDRSVDGYTMIVGSSPDRAAADEQMSRFTELDLPFGVLDYSEEESSMYRLAVGLYDSAARADSARQAMSDTLPSGTWVWRIR